MSSALWWVVNGRAMAPPATGWSTGVSTSRNPRSSRYRRTTRRTVARARTISREPGSVASCRWRHLCCRSASFNPCHFSGRGRRDLVSMTRWLARIESSPFRVVITGPAAPTRSPRSISSRSARSSSPRKTAEQNSWMSPVPSRNTRNTSLPKLRLSTTRPATETWSSVTVSGGRSEWRSRSSAAWAVGSKVRANGSTPRARRRSRLSRRAFRTSRSRPPASSASPDAGSREVSLMVGADVALEDQAQTLEREPLVVVVDGLAERNEQRREPARGDDLRVDLELLADPTDHAVGLGRRSVDEGRLDGLDRVLPDDRARGVELHLWQPRCRAR